jgi:hypothetical protein
MKNARIHEALCRISNVTEAPYPWALEQGPHTGWEIAITKWDMDMPRPTQEELDAVYMRLAEEDAQREVARDVPVGEVDRLIAQFPTVGWDILKLRGIE